MVHRYCSHNINFLIGQSWPLFHLFNTEDIKKFPMNKFESRILTLGETALPNLATTL